jgi:(2R)-sulfolactate sulfo-lyase subunit alpha
MSKHKFLVHDSEDSVGVAVQNIQAGEEVIGVIMDPDREIKVRSNHDIPLGHKIALKALKKGDNLVKYGENVGKVTADIQVGDWVHTHNLKTARWDYGN